MKSLSIKPHRAWQTHTFAATSLNTWLKDKGSLTASLQAHYADFSVRPLKVAYAKPHVDECRALRLRMGQRALIREVLLQGHGKAVVYAHSVLPRSSLCGAWRGLGKLGKQPLGAALFGNKHVKRSAIQYKKLSIRHPLQVQVQTYLNIKKPMQGLIARRSLFQLGRASLLVTEVFLPTIISK